MELLGTSWSGMFIPSFHPRINLYCGNVESDAELVDMHTRWHCLKERILDLMKFVHAMRVMGRQQVVLSAFVWPCALDLPGVQEGFKSRCLD